jgi:hypothetical protein
MTSRVFLPCVALIACNGKTAPPPREVVVDVPVADAAPAPQASAARAPPREVHADERSPIRLSLGDRAIFGAWDVKWNIARDGLVFLEARFRQQRVAEWNATVEPKHDVETHDRLFAFEVKLVSSSDDQVEIAARTTDFAPRARFGDKLSPGVFVFPDGLRINIVQLHGCDYDVSDPCTFGGAYRADALLGKDEAHVDLKSARTPILGHVVELGRGTFSVRK